MKPTTLEEALSLVPTHWPLTQDVCDNDMFSRLDEMENYRRPRVSASSLQKMRENSTGGVMTPEEAKPRDLDDLFEEGWNFKVGRIDGAGWFTAKETAEIAKAYGRACLHSYMDKAADTVERFENLFEEWSK